VRHWDEDDVRIRPGKGKSRPRSKNKVDNVFINDRLRAVLPGLRFTPMEEGIARLLEGM